MRSSAEKATSAKAVMENFQGRQIPRDDKWRDISNIHREESECKMLQEKMQNFWYQKKREKLRQGYRREEFPH